MELKKKIIQMKNKIIKWIFTTVLGYFISVFLISAILLMLLLFLDKSYYWGALFGSFLTTIALAFIKWCKNDFDSFS